MIARISEEKSVQPQQYIIQNRSVPENHCSPFYKSIFIIQVFHSIYKKNHFLKYLMPEY